MGPKMGEDTGSRARGCGASDASSEAGTPGAERRRLHSGGTGKGANWRDVAHALDVLERRQASMREEFQHVRCDLQHHIRCARQSEITRQEELAGLRAAHAAATFQYRRQGHALVGRAVAAGRQAKRAKSLVLRAQAELMSARSELEETRAELKGALSALAARSTESKKLRARVAALDQQLGESAKVVQSTQQIASDQEQLLDEAAAAIVSLQRQPVCD